MGPMHVPELTVRFLANFKSMLQCCCLSLLGTKECFPNFFVISQPEHYIFLEGVDSAVCMAVNRIEKFVYVLVHTLYTVQTSDAS